MFINQFEELSETRKGFYYAYEVDEGQCLCRVFWVDAEARRNYSLFGEAVTFDPTYSTNRYNMIFAPFTGVDHHKRSVTFGAALMSKENEQNFKWVFLKFLDAMGGREPQCFFTDQDPAIKLAIPAVFKTSAHRFCMWHIMQKLPEKVGMTVTKETDFVSHLNAVVWDSELEPSDFEERWSELISEFQMGDNRWLRYMFSIRQHWIPAYFRDIPLGCLLRTTQRSESESNFFKRFENPRGTLVEFWLCFQSAMDQQRYTQKCLDRDSDYSLPETKTLLKLESHASTVFTHTLFYEFQQQCIDSLHSCSAGDCSRDVTTRFIGVDDSMMNKSYIVAYNPTTIDATCSCKMFERKGYICKHIIWIFSGKGVKKIPDKYLLSRWTKNTKKMPIYDAHGQLMDDFDSSDLIKMRISNVWSEFYSLLAVLKSLPPNHVTELTDLLKTFRQNLKPVSETMTKRQELEMLLGCSYSTEVRILPPVESKNKGSGKRLSSKRQQGIAKAQKPKRFCNNCKQMTHHDKRNCPHPAADRAISQHSGDNESEVSIFVTTFF
ncbi:hypothetical protein RND81_01G014300 [Saponaria officinalis]|uniref:SWIM-type domain-containing protein n=1 Tax=Saponaria officinalis TaxID=3572 RepID=A0AAW1NAU6_SAPOF